ncbi:AGAP003070-PA-like protein [Anopheles sinensis]|uniref:ADAM10 endopeptidase n=1 Tax=Anopheles sinensis TaxID=74873 RepID=A0A084VZG8_ANOSI|nr:AGAP003070-PA-like protein [Anopheles sinensis]
MRKTRRKRWLEEVQESRNPSLPLDLEVPYNNDYTIVRSNGKTQPGEGAASQPTRPTINRTINRGIIGGTGGNGPPIRAPTPTINNRKNHFLLYNVYNPQGSGSTIITGGGMVAGGGGLVPEKLGSDEASIESITRHVQRANFIYSKTDFNGDGKPDNITFMIKRIKVHNQNALKDPSYRFPGSYGVEKFLELFSEEDYDAFCLAYMFTYRDFEMGTLGLAWTGDLKNAGGVCEKNGHYRGSLKSLNTGIVTLLNYGKHVPPAVSHVTLAHEIGHNFGSPHDPEQCTPGGEDGNFIMFARATSGDKRNNNRFSPCSLKAIEPVLNAKARSAKGCFTEPQEAICGNGVVETGEECDCGWEEDCKDSCCYPMSRHPRFDQKPCTLTPKAQCSPSQGPCCTLECTLKLGDKCRDDNGCRDPAYCDGLQPVCPPSINKPNKTICNKEYVCYMGECTGSICLAYGLESCQCTVGPADPAIKACELCCKQPGEDKPCLSSFDWNDPPYDVPDMYAKPGTPCNEYNGYCDVAQKCREVDPSGPLATLRKLLLSEESIASFKRWIYANWYTVALIVTVIFVLLVLSAKLLGKRTNLKLKTVTIIHSATTETVRLPDDNNGVIVHTAVRTKVPLKKKVRGERSAKPSTKGGPAAAKAAGVTHGQQQQQAKQLLATVNGATTTTTAVLPSTSKELQQRQLSSSMATGGVNPASMVIKQVKRHVGRTTTTTTAATTSGDSPKKLLKRKKKRSSGTAGGGGPSDESPVKESPTAGVKPQKKHKKPKSKHKEVIDYSSRNATDAHTHSNTFGKVHRWLLESPIVSTGQSSSSAAVASAAAATTAQYEHTPASVANIMSKSQSTPDHLTQQAIGAGVGATQQASARSPKKTRVKTKSVGNLNEKVRLQVVYKPPFKFSLKLSKNDPSSVVTGVKTHVVAGPVAGKRKNRPTALSERKRVGPGLATLVDNGLEGQPRKRSAILVRQPVTPEEKIPIIGSSEPNYETLNPRTVGSDGESHTYENVTFGHSDETAGDNPVPSINTATFRINRSASGTHLQNHPLVKSASQTAAGASRGSTSNLHNAPTGTVNGRDRTRRSSVHNHHNASNAFRSFAGDSTECLIRSSTTNLSGLRASHGVTGSGGKRNSFADKKRSSATNLTRLHSGSASNLHSLKRHGSSSQFLMQDGGSSSRRNSVTQTPPGHKLSRSASNGPSASARHPPPVAGTNSGTLGSHSNSSSNGSGHHHHHNHHHHHQRRSSIGTGAGKGGPTPSQPVPLARQTSLNVKPPTSPGASCWAGPAFHQPRPHTSSCADDMLQQRPFEWPRVATAGGNRTVDDPLPSDLEVMVSDVENLVGDR